MKTPVGRHNLRAAKSAAETSRIDAAGEADEDAHVAFYSFAHFGFPLTFHSLHDIKVTGNKQQKDFYEDFDIVDDDDSSRLWAPPIA